MCDITILLLGAGVIMNAVGNIVLAVAIKRQNCRIDNVESEALKVFVKNERYASFSEQCFKNFCYVKDGFRKVREELIKKEILTQDFKYLDEDEVLEEFIDKFLKS